MMFCGFYYAVSSLAVIMIRLLIRSLLRHFRPEAAPVPVQVLARFLRTFKSLHVEPGTCLITIQIDFDATKITLRRRSFSLEE